MASNEAMAMAEKLVKAVYNEEQETWELWGFGLFLEWFYKEIDARKYEGEIKSQIATALDARTEALRAERDKYQEQVRGFQGAVLELLMVAEPDFGTKTFTVPFEEWDYLMSADQNAKDPNQKEIII